MRTWILVGLVACGGSDPAHDSPSAEGTGTPPTMGSDTTPPGPGTSTTDTAPTTTTPQVACIDVFPSNGYYTTGFVRFVNLLFDPPSVELTLNDGDALIPAFPSGATTDINGKYIPFPPGIYAIAAEYGGDPVARQPNLSVGPEEWSTWILYGDPSTAGAEPAWATVRDDPCVAPGYHEVRVFHMGVGGPDVDVWIGGTLHAAGLPYGAETGFVRVSSGFLDLELDTDGDGVADRTFPLGLRDEDFSHVYVLHDAADFYVAHYVRGQGLEFVY